jgi:hypothetical protein
LCPKTTFNDFFRRILTWVFHLIPSNLHVPALGSPAKQALLRAGVQRGRHLNATVGLDAIELLFVADSAVNYGFVEPLAPFNRRVTSDEMVLLLLECSKKRRGRLVFQGVHRVSVTLEKRLLKIPMFTSHFLLVNLV